MVRFLLLAAALAVALGVSPLAPAHAETPYHRGSTVEVEDCFYSFELGSSWWSLECRYRVDGGEWQRAYREGTGGMPELHLPGTSVTAHELDRRIEFTADDDVASLRVGPRRVK
jgi:hypothetical protein